MKTRSAIICGGRNFSEIDYPGVRKFLKDFLESQNVTEEICGMAIGADMFGMDIAEHMGIKVNKFYADWDMTIPEFKDDPKSIAYNPSGEYSRPYNKLAGINRNKRMAKYAKNNRGICIALPGGRGTQDMIKQAKENEIPVYVLSVKTIHTGETHSKDVNEYEFIRS